MGDTSQTQILLNVLKHGSMFTYGKPIEYNNDGYPLNGTTTDTRYFSIPDLPNQTTEYTGNWVFKWTGSGPQQIQFGAPGVTIVSGGSFVSSGTPNNINTTTGADGKIVFSFNGAISTIFYGFLTGVFSNLSNVIICRADHEADVDAGKIWNPAYIAKYVELRPKILRPMGWTNPNGQLSGQWAYRMPLTHIAWEKKFATGAWVGDISGTNTYTCGASPDNTTLVHLMAIQGHFLNDNTGVSTLNFNGTGAKKIYGRDAVDVSVGDIITESAAISTLVYDSGLNAGAGAWMQETQPFRVGYPLEALIDFANLANVDLWINFNHLDTDATIQSKVALVRDTLNTSLNAYFEFSNEVWNFAFGFQQSQYAKAKGIALGFTSSWEHVSWYAKRYAEIMPLVASTWAPRNASQLKRVIAVFVVGDKTNETNFRMLGTDLGAYGFNGSPNRPIDNCEVISYASYYRGAQLQNFDPNYQNTMTELLDAADDYDSGNPTLMNNALDFIDSDIRNGTRNGSPGDATLQSFITTNNTYPGWNAIAVTYNKNVICYEGGMECAAPSTSRLTALGLSTAYSAKIAALLTAYKNDNRFKLLVKQQMNDFMAQSKSVSPAWLLMVGPNNWSTHPGQVLFTTPFKSWDAMVELNHA